MKSKLLAVLLLLVCTLAACRESDIPQPSSGAYEASSESERSSEESISIYNTNKYQMYKRLSHLVMISDDELQIPYTGAKSIDGKEYYIFEKGPVRVQIEKKETPETNYSLYLNDVFHDDFVLRNVERHPQEISIICADIAGERLEEIIIKQETWYGTGPQNCWSFAYDIVNSEELSFLGKESDLTEKQLTQLTELLSQDVGFQELFGTYDYLGGTHPYVDEYGKVYLQMGIIEGVVNVLGEIFILFEYNTEEKCFDVMEYLYMPYRIENN